MPRVNKAAQNEYMRRWRAARRSVPGVRVCRNPTCGTPFPVRRTHSFQVYCCTKCRHGRPRPERREAQAEYKKRWLRTEEGRAYQHRKNHTPKNRAARKKYQYGRNALFQTLKFLAQMEIFTVAIEAAEIAPVKGAVVSAELQTLLDRADAMTTEDLLASIAGGLRLHRENLLWLGAQVVRLEARGVAVDLAKMDAPWTVGTTDGTMFVSLLRKIGSGLASVNAVVRFAGRPVMLCNILKHPMKEQEWIARMSYNQAEMTVKKLMAKRSEDLGKRTLTPPAYNGPALPAVADQLHACSPGDAVEMLRRLILDAADPPAVARGLLPFVTELAGGEPTRNGRPTKAR